MNVFFNDQHRHNGSLRLRYRLEHDECLALVDMAQVSELPGGEQQTLLSWLSGEEKKYLERFRFPKRYKEWLSGRIAAKCCLLQTGEKGPQPQRPDDFSILPDSHGRPILSGPRMDPPVRLSISHSHQYAVAMAANQACGVDIQHIGPQILKVRDRIATAEELALADSLLIGSREAGLTLLWVIKEAVKKHLLPEQPGIFEAISVKGISPAGKKNYWQAQCRLIENKQSQIVRIVRLEDYMMAWCRG